MARRAVQTLVKELVAAGGEYRLAAVRAARRRRDASTACGPPTRRDAARRSLRLRLRALAAEGVPVDRRQAHLPDAPGGLLLRARERRRPLRAAAACPAGRTSTTATSTTASPTSRAAGSRSPTTRTASPFDPDDRRPPAHARPALDDVPRVPEAAVPRPRRAPDGRGARLPVREQLERRLPHRPPPALGERAPRRRGIRPRLQARPGRRPLRRRPPDRPPGASRAALQPGDQGRRRSTARSTERPTSTRRGDRALNLDKRSVRRRTTR